jgi:hypothetical protein
VLSLLAFEADYSFAFKAGVLTHTVGGDDFSFERSAHLIGEAGEVDVGRALTGRYLVLVI